MYMTREFVFMPEFDTRWKNLGFTDNEQKDVEAYLCEHPDAGPVIRGTGGLRKFRWSQHPGQGKSGGARILYVDFASYEQIYMITCFAKNKQVNISDAEKKAIKALLEHLKMELRRKT